MGTWISQREGDCGDDKTKAALCARGSDECNGITFTNWSPKSLQTIVLIGIKHPECINETLFGVYRRCGCCCPSACWLTVWCVRAKPLGVLTGSVTSLKLIPPPLSRLRKTGNGELTYAAHYTLYTAYYTASAILAHWCAARDQIWKIFSAVWSPHNGSSIQGQ